MMQSTLFSRNSSRIADTRIADFLHGHCLRFQDFTFSVLKANRDLVVPLCLECGLLPDSPYHQVLECTSFQSSYSDALNLSIGKFETNFHIPLIFDQEDESIPQVAMLYNELGILSCYGTAELSRINFKNQIQFICATSQFGDQLLTS